ncbi:hypothetical protein [Pseudomonas uvaldensis]|uniref:hypothetical protein n=1 Tax=Pseudomonas uvaldensis TaxID=2878385 RepID=UPI001E410DB9|nr:hypothetical protein [Pseudomonas uvaldensis]MCE0462510.1 hypothetical protein [Pseudomonas uvaldensis]
MTSDNDLSEGMPPRLRPTAAERFGVGLLNGIAALIQTDRPPEKVRTKKYPVISRLADIAYRQFDDALMAAIFQNNLKTAETILFGSIKNPLFCGPASRR